MVRLKGEPLKMVLDVLYYFNSNMVRLKGDNNYASDGGFGLFQFQHGSIKRHSAFFRILYVVTFQFQHGSIKSEH